MYKWIWPHTCMDGENMVMFTDSRKHAYTEGDVYPAEGISVSDEHIKYMLGGNKFGNLYIEEVEKEKPRKKREVKDTEE